MLLGKNLKKIVFGLAWLLPAFFFCQSIFAQETAEVLPQGIFRARTVTIVGAPLTEEFGSNSNLQSVVAPLNQTLYARQQAAGSPALKSLYNALNQFQSGLGDALFQTNLVAAGQINFRRQVAALEYGLTNTITLGFVAPVTQMDVLSSFNISSPNNAQAVLKKVHGLTVLEQGVKTFVKTLNATNYGDILFTSRGYQLPASLSLIGLGDIELGAKFRFLKTDHMIGAFESGFRLPTTTHIANQAILLDQSTGDKALVFGVTGYYNYNPTPDLSFGMATEVLMPFSDSRRMAVAFPGQTELPNLNDPNQYDNVERLLGDSLTTDLSASYYFLRHSISAYCEYEYDVHAQDSYSGTKGLDYYSLQVGTNTWAHHFEVGMGYSTVAAYLRRAISIPFEARLAYNTMFAGLNTPAASYARLDLYLYF